VPAAGGVRPEYEVLARDFRTLAAPFRITVDEALERDLVLVAASFEVIDRHVDATADGDERTRMCDAILGALREGRADDLLRGELTAVLATTRARLVEIAALDAFARHLARFFVRSEVLRRTTRGGEFVHCVLDEARCAAAMTLLFVPAEPAFARFFRVLSEIANLVDKLHDVRGDRARGEIAVRPDLALHVRLLVAFAARLPALLWRARRPFRLVAWGTRYVLPARATEPAPRAPPAASVSRRLAGPANLPPR
jgi:hypothetical protein